MGFSLLSLTRTSYNAFFWVTLQPWEDRKTIEEQFQVIKAKLNLKLLTLPQGTVFAFSPPAISGVGTSGGFQFVLEDRAGKDPEFLVNNLNKFLEAARKRPEIGMVTTTYIPSTPQKFVYVDKEKVLKQGVKLSDVYDTLQAFMGGLFVNYFNDFGRAWQVRVEAEAPYRSNLDNAGQFYVRNNQGRDGAAVGADPVRVALRAGIQDAVQPVFGGANYRQRCSGLQLRAGHRGAGRGVPPDDAAGDGLRLHGHVSAGAKGAGGYPIVELFSGSRCCSSSSFLRHCMKAGRCRSVSC